MSDTSSTGINLDSHLGECRYWTPHVYRWEGLMAQAVLHGAASIKKDIDYHGWSSYPFSVEVIRCDPGKKIKVISGYYNFEKRGRRRQQYVSYFGSKPTVLQVWDREFSGDQSGHYVHMELELTDSSLIIASCWTSNAKWALVDSLLRESDWINGNFHERFTLYACATSAQIEHIAFCMKRNAEREQETDFPQSNEGQRFAACRKNDLMLLGFGETKACKIIRCIGPERSLQTVKWTASSLLEVFRRRQIMQCFANGSYRKPEWSTGSLEASQHMLICIIRGAIATLKASQASELKEYLTFYGLSLPDENKSWAVSFLDASLEILAGPIPASILSPKMEQPPQLPLGQLELF